METQSKPKKIIRRTNKDESINGTAGDDAIWGLGGNDTIYAGNGDDIISGGKGDDDIWGDEGNDAISGDEGNDFINGGPGNDTVSGGFGNDTLYSSEGNDILKGGPGDDELREAYGRNRLAGDDGDDTFFLSGGVNYADGGAGNDIFFIASNSPDPSDLTPSTLVGGSGSDWYSFGALDGWNDDGYNPVGNYRIKEDFSEKNWGTIDFGRMNITVVRAGATPNPKHNNLFMRQVGANVVLSVKYWTGAWLNVVVENTSLKNVRAHMFFPPLSSE